MNPYLSEINNIHGRSWSNQRGYGYLQMFSEKPTSFLCQNSKDTIATFNKNWNRLEKEPTPYSSPANTHMAWDYNTNPQIKKQMNETCCLVPNDDFSPRVPWRETDFDMSFLNCPNYANKMYGSAQARIQRNICEDKRNQF